MQSVFHPFVFWFGHRHFEKYRDFFQHAFFISLFCQIRVREERQNFDINRHYSRLDVLQLKVNRERQNILKFEDWVKFLLESLFDFQSEYKYQFLCPVF